MELRDQILVTKNRIGILQDQLKRYEGYNAVRDMVTRERKRVVQEQLATYREQYGTLDPGESRVRDDALPKSTDGKNKVSLTARTVKGAGITTDEFADLIDEQVAEGKLTYLPISNNATTKKAREEIERDGWKKSLEDWSHDVRNGKVSAKLTAKGAILLNNAAQAGDRDTWLDILHDYQHMGTSAGQAIQALRILKQLAPEDKLHVIKRSIGQLIQDTGIKFSVDDIVSKIDPEILEMYKKAETYEEEEQALQEIGAIIAEYVPATFTDKWTALRYLNMLGYYDNDTVMFENPVGGYVEGEYFIPIRFGLKHSVTGRATLYLIVDQQKIDLKKIKAEVAKATAVQNNRPITSRSAFNISVSRFVPFILHYPSIENRS